MPRAFLVVKKPQQPGGVMEIPSAQQESLKRPRTDDNVDPAAVRYMAPLSGIMMEQPRPSSASPAASYVSSDEPYSPATSEHREGRCSPPSDPPTLSCPTTGLPFSGLPSMYDMNAKRQRLFSETPSTQDKVCNISPGSSVSDTGSDASVVPSPCKPSDLHPAHPYMMFNPKDMASQVSSADQLQPLSPLHRLVQQPHPLGFPAFPPFPMPFMRAPMFLPHHFKPYSQTLPSEVPPAQQSPKGSQDKKPSKPSPRPRISHNIDDLLARSPPKPKKPLDTTVKQPKPILVQDVTPKDGSRAPLSPRFHSPADSPMHQLVAMEKMYSHSPRTLPQSPRTLPQSPKTGSFAPISNSPTSPRSKSRSAPRNLEEDFKKQYLETILPEALRQRQQRLAEDYRELLRLQNNRLAMEQQVKAEVKEEHPKEQHSFPRDLSRNYGASYASEYGREAVFPHRLGEGGERMHPALAERLSPSALDNLPVDFSKACSKRSGPPRFQCDGCKKSYSTLNGLSKHKEFHCVSHVKKEFSCKQCSKTYTSLGALKMHIRTHTLPCKCQLCGKSFSRPWLLQGHIRTHTGEKPFSCQHCQRSFADRSNLRAHLQTHTDIKRYSCDTCTKTFSRMSLLTKHRENGCSQVNMLHRH